MRSETEDKTQKNEPVPANLQEMTATELSSSASLKKKEQSTLNDVDILIVDKGTRRRRHDGREDGHHFHEHDEGLAWRNREARQL